LDREGWKVFGRYDPEKAQQAAGVLFQALDCRSMSRMKLLKLLYIADRESVRETGVSITGDTAVAMEWGPVLSATYNCIKEEGPIAEQWMEHFHSPTNTLVVMTHSPGTRRLARYEVDKLEEVARRFGAWTPAQLSKHTHTFPEWAQNQPPPGSRNLISPNHVLEAVGRGADASRLLQESEAYAAVQNLFASVPR
jgi:uncharacterized phage-associated protein